MNRVKKFINDKENQNIKVFIGITVFIMTVIIYKIYSQNHNFESLKKTSKTWAIISKMRGPTYTMPPSIDFFFFNKSGEKIEIIDVEPFDCFDVRKEKDTIFIKYSLTDNYVTEILHCFWNERLKNEIN